ncbi:NAD-dependent epimerase/dehydratase family protein (plasmid) [Ensifer adhaerens]|uniref:NAD-dependent epimerase/dehydratase family protein n=1 Tax=Ensifer adhaerens TaxID=106592 RepID=UPI0023A94C8E|nr:NAD-dependent epimerase/dehydratase family protein [Ensifer adhaerens]WDZ80946.1 NAD-dependent epimerase/dehydratase family protein [Ensifer adhaerens]
MKGKVAGLKAFGRRQSFPEVLKDVDWFQGDFNDPSSLAAAIEGCDVVFHLVNATTPASANVDKVADVRLNVTGSLQMLEVCRAQNVKRVIFASSGGTIYGIPEILPTPEDASCWPLTSYGISKLSVERYLHLYSYLYGIDYRVVRIANPFGPFQVASKNQGVIAAFLRRMLSDQPVEVWGDGSVARDYVYIEDVADALVLAAKHVGEDKIFNIGSGVARTINEVIESLETVTGRRCRVIRREGRMVDVPISVLDVGRARQSLRWEPQTQFEEGLERTFRWLLQK